MQGIKDVQSEIINLFKKYEIPSLPYYLNLACAWKKLDISPYWQEQMRPNFPEFIDKKKKELQEKSDDDIAKILQKLTPCMEIYGKSGQKVTLQQHDYCIEVHGFLFDMLYFLPEGTEQYTIKQLSYFDSAEVKMDDRL
jgi:hypothetical protein